MNKIHVLVIPTWYPNGIDKLMGKYHMDFCHALSCDGRMKVNMLYVDRQGLSLAGKFIFSKKKYSEQNDGYTTYSRKMLDRSKLGFDVQIKAYVKTLLKIYDDYEKINGKPDIIHAQVAVPAGYASCILGEKIGVPVIMTEHATYYENYFTGREKNYNEVVMKNAFITCVGDFMVDVYKKHGVDAYVLPNIVDCKKFDLPKITANKPRFNVVSVGALRTIERYENTMDVVKELKKEIPFIHFTIVGDGENEEFFKNHCHNIGMDDTVSFVGRKTHDEIGEIFRDKDCLVVASDFETFGIPAVEALAAGLPVVSTKNYGTQMFLNEDTGYLCEVDDKADLKRAILEMYKNKDKFSQEKLKEIASGFDAKKVADMAFEYYKKILTK